MPTGYTAKIIEGDGIAFKQFAMECARAFGALITMRDDPIDASIPEVFEPSSYYRDAEEEAKRCLAELEAMDQSKRIAYGKSSIDKSIAGRIESIAETNRVLGRLNAMMERVVQWLPPSSDHLELKKFMLDQIDDTIRLDGDPSWGKKDLERLQAADPYAVWQQARDSAESNIEYDRLQYAKAVSRCAECSKWVADLRRSLEG